MKYLLLLLILPAALTGCGESVEPGTPVTSITLCFESADDYSDCQGKEVADVAIFVIDPDLDFEGDRDPGECITATIDDGSVVVGDEITMEYALEYDDGEMSEAYPLTLDIDDTATTFTIPCP